MQRPGVALVLEFKAKDENEEIKMDELSVMNLNQKLKLKKSKWMN